MSLILEALKKSEARRRIGEAPDIGTPFATAAPRRGPLPLIIVAIVLAAGVGWWLQHEPSVPVADKSASVATGAGNSTAASNAPPKRTVAANVPPMRVLPADHPPTTPAPSAMNAPAGVQPATTPPPVPPNALAALPGRAAASNALPPGAWVATGQSARTPQKSSTTMPVAAARTAAATPSAAPAPTRANAPAAPAPVAAAVPAPASPAINMQPGIQPPASATATAPIKNPTAATSAPIAADAATAAKPAPAAPDDVGGAQPYYELPFSVRKDLPPIKLSMHVYATDPAQRFVVLNDSRMSQGDSQDDLTLREIRPDGVVIDFHGQRFFYPRDGL
jgi:general secretion pathway protein B